MKETDVRIAHTCLRTTVFLKRNTLWLSYYVSVCANCKHVFYYKLILTLMFDLPIYSYVSNVHDSSYICSDAHLN